MTEEERYTFFDENFGLKGKTAIITGSGSGIGIEIAKMYARKGANVVSVDKSIAPDLQEYVEKQGVKYLAILGDLTDEEFVNDTIVNTVVGIFGKIDILVNCAGVGVLETLDNSTREIWNLTMAVNLTAGVNLSLAVGKRMKETGGGSIINIASQAGVIAIEGHLSYGTAKAGLIQATKQFALEWGQFGIRANCISPEVILTPMGKMNWDNPKGEEAKKMIPSRRFGYPQEVAALAVYLGSDAASLINGTNIMIDGGNTIW